jgi:hypothetical protein
MWSRSFVLALSMVSFAHAADPVSPPKGLPPRFMTVAKIDKDVIELIEVEPVEGMAGASTESTRKAPIKSLHGFDRKGKELDRDAWLKRLKSGDVVVVATDDQKVAPAYLAVLKDDAVVLWGVRVLAPAPVDPE